MVRCGTSREAIPSRLPFIVYALVGFALLIGGIAGGWFVPIVTGLSFWFLHFSRFEQ
jgi:hypothetical protein